MIHFYFNCHSVVLVRSGSALMVVALVVASVVIDYAFVAVLAVTVCSSVSSCDCLCLLLFSASFSSTVPLMLMRC